MVRFSLYLLLLLLNEAWGYGLFSWRRDEFRMIYIRTFSCEESWHSKGSSPVDLRLFFSVMCRVYCVLHSFITPCDLIKNMTRLSVSQVAWIVSCERDCDRTWTSRLLYTKCGTQHCYNFQATLTKALWIQNKHVFIVVNCFVCASMFHTKVKSQNKENNFLCACGLQALLKLRRGTIA